VFLGYYHSQARYKCLHPSGKVYVSRHVQFNPNEFPFPSLFNLPCSSSSLNGLGYSTSYFQSLPSRFSSPRVAQCLHPSLSPVVSSSNVHHASDIESILREPQPVSSSPSPNPNPTSISKSKPGFAPSVHPMVTRSKAQNLVTTSPHALVSSLEPCSVREALVDS